MLEESLHNSDDPEEIIMKMLIAAVEFAHAVAVGITDLSTAEERQQKTKNATCDKGYK